MKYLKITILLILVVFLSSLSVIGCGGGDSGGGSGDSPPISPSVTSSPSPSSTVTPTTSPTPTSSPTSSPTPSPTPPPSTLYPWGAKLNGNILEIAYGSGNDFPQYAAFYTNSSYFRMVYGPDSGWGTSIILMPSFWESGNYYQGAPISASWNKVGDNLVIPFTGTISNLQVEGKITLSPPIQDQIEAHVTIITDGSAQIDTRPGEAFKPVMLSSMHISDSEWDSQSAYTSSRTYQIPVSGWIINPPVNNSVFGLTGGTSSWKTNAPTIEIQMTTNRQITGWVTESTNPNEDNTGFWAASDDVLLSWEYTIIAKKK